jgi:hypothetical protein
MLKTKLQAFFAVKGRLIAVIIVVIAASGSVVYIILAHHKPSDLSPSEKAAKVTQLNEESTGLQVKGDYATAAQKQIEAYNYLKDGPDKAMQAENVGTVFESARDYAQALTWYGKARDQYNALGNKDAASTVGDSIKRVASYQRPSPPSDPKQPTDGGN